MSVPKLNLVVLDYYTVYSARRGARAGRGGRISRFRLRGR
eukprot:SAG31_NODE_990_length_10529_cov_37.528340_14_plen_40_part_00